MSLVARGKVRDVYEAGGRLLMVASDRISTFDRVHPTPVPGKGLVLTGISVFWFERTRGICPNHLVSYEDVPDEWRGRALLVERLEMVPLECVVRGRLAGSAWRDYTASGRVAGIELPGGLTEGQRLPEPLFTPATKASGAAHDETVSFEQAVEIAGDRARVEELRRLSLALFEHARSHLEARGVILADTKFEWGMRPDGGLVLGDEAITPDSSRLWPGESPEPGASWDKQPVRDWADASGWDRSEPAPALPPEVVEATALRYREAYERVTGEPLEAWIERSGAVASAAA